MSGVRTAWDYTECAAHYESRPDYAAEAIRRAVGGAASIEVPYVTRAWCARLRA